MALVIVGLFLGFKIYQFHRFPQTYQNAHSFYAAIQTASGQPMYTPVGIMLIWCVKFAVWLVETGIFVGYIASYVSRAKAIGIARGFMETAFPIGVAGIPVLIALTPYSLPRWLPFSSAFHLPFYLIIMGFILLGGLINLIGLLTLRRAFTIMTEARTVISHGIFRWVRHPLYLGHFIAFFGSLMLRLHAYTVVMYLVFCIGQVIRARLEERKLASAFPGYETYKQKTGMFFPRAFR